MEPLLLTPKEAAKALGLSQSYVYELLASEVLPSITIGRTRRIPRRALEAFVEARATEQIGYAPHPTGGRLSRPIPS
jgi:excisionase family DNA binding protein